MKNIIKGTSILSGLIAIAILVTSFRQQSTDTNESVAKRHVARTASGAVIRGALSSVYDSLHLDMAGLSKEAFDYTMQGLEELRGEGKLDNDSIVTICDFSKPSSEKRLYILDLRNYRILFNTWVAHGRNSGREMAASFSNTMSSYKSSLGFYRTGDTYIGGNGYSLKLHGLEKGINDKALERAIVLHGADYVSSSFLQSNGFMGRSYGCPAVAMPEARPIINAIKGGTCLFIYSNDARYLSTSSLLRHSA